MDWKREAEENLRLYRKRKEALSAMSMELAGLTGSDPEDAARRGELTQLRDRTAIRVALVERGLENLNGEDRMLLEKCYIDPMPGRVEWLCCELECEHATVYRRRDRALRNFTLGMYGEG